MKILSKALTTVAGVAAVSAAMITDAQAIPAFARQTGMACVSCHAGSFPALNAFGRAFLSSSYTMRGAAPLVEGEDLSIPADLKMSLVTKLRYQMDSSRARGEFQWPDEAGLLVGGRMAENIGGMAELDMKAADADNNFANMKVSFNVTPNVTAVLWGTDGLGPGYGFELMNTGLKRSQRPIENRKGMSAFQRLGTGATAAEGWTVAYHDNDLAIAYSQWADAKGNANVDIFGGMASNLRVSYFMNAAGWDMGFGLSAMSGTLKIGANETPDSEYDLIGQGVDFQMIGDIGSIPSAFYLSYGMTPGSTASKMNKFNYDKNAPATPTDDKTAIGFLGKFDVLPRTSVYAAYGSTDQGSSTSSEVTVGVEYMLAQNVKLELFNVDYDKSAAPGGDNDYTMLELFSGF